ncbi:hypothetical protein BDZ88DRAFT_436515 [Geranomyces variabilis]|nr:hypothetical protein BDZ88DRAFT_436515 [Geranomyces variabilis]
MDLYCDAFVLLIPLLPSFRLGGLTAHAMRKEAFEWAPPRVCRALLVLTPIWRVFPEEFSQIAVISSRPVQGILAPTRSSGTTGTGRVPCFRPHAKTAAGVACNWHGQMHTVLAGMQRYEDDASPRPVAQSLETVTVKHPGILASVLYTCKFLRVPEATDPGMAWQAGGPVKMVFTEGPEFTQMPMISAPGNVWKEGLFRLFEKIFAFLCLVHQSIGLKPPFSASRNLLNFQAGQAVIETLLLSLLISAVITQFDTYFSHPETDAG